MKAQITITGQIGGNFTLRNAILRSADFQNISSGRFNVFYINFKTIGEAKNAMRGAWKLIKSENDNLLNRDGLNVDASTLSFDSSIAVINKILY